MWVTTKNLKLCRQISTDIKQTVIRTSLCGSFYLCQNKTLFHVYNVIVRCSFFALKEVYMNIVHIPPSFLII